MKTAPHRAPPAMRAAPRKAPVAMRAAPMRAAPPPMRAPPAPMRAQPAREQQQRASRRLVPRQATIPSCPQVMWWVLQERLAKLRSRAAPALRLQLQDRQRPKLEAEAAVAAGEVQHHALLLGAVAAEAALPLLLGRCAERSQL